MELAEIRSRDAEIAQAMGWEKWEGPGRQWKAPASWKGNRQFHNNPPEFHADESARRALLEWLAADEKRWDAFVEQLTIEIIGHPYPLCPELLRLMILATPTQVAEAALRVIREAAE